MGNPRKGLDNSSLVCGFSLWYRSPLASPARTRFLSPSRFNAGFMLYALHLGCFTIPAGNCICGCGEFRRKFLRSLSAPHRASFLPSGWVDLISARHPSPRKGGQSPCPVPEKIGSPFPRASYKTPLADYVRRRTDETLS